MMILLFINFSISLEDIKMVKLLQLNCSPIHTVIYFNIKALLRVDSLTEYLQGKKLARPYAKAVSGMLPKWYFQPDEPKSNVPFEPVNDVHIHRHTMQQLFAPVAESRDFTRKDAAAAFYDTMLPADARSPQRGLIAMERKNLTSTKPADRRANWEAFEEAERRQEEKFAARLAEMNEAEEAATTRVKTDRYEFRFREMNVDDAGADGRSTKGLGSRYGAPHMDRKRGMVKIPTSVP